MIDQAADAERTFAVAADTEPQVTPGPVVLQRDDAQGHCPRGPTRRRLRDDADPDAGLHQQADGVEAAQLDTQAQAPSRALGPAGEKPMQRAGRLKPHKVPIEYVLERDGLLLAQRIARLGNDHEAVRTKGNDLQGSGLHGSGHDANIGNPLRDQPHDLVTEPLLKVDRRARKGAEETAERFGKKFRQRVRVAEQPHVAAGPVGIAGEILLHPLGLCQQRLGMGKQRVPGRRQADTLPASLHQLRPERSFHVAQACARRGEGDMGALRSRGDASGFGDIPKQTQVVEVGANHGILRFSRIFPFEHTHFAGNTAAVIFGKPKRSMTLDLTFVLSACLVAATIGLWATAALPEYLVALLFFAAVAVLRLAPPDVLFSGFASAAFWLVLSGFVLGAAIRKVGLADRIAERLSGHLARSWLRMVGGVVLLAYVLAFFMPSNMGRIALLMPIAMALADRAGLDAAGRGRTGLALAVGFATFQLSASILPANVPNLVMAGAAESAYGLHLSYLAYLALHAPILGLLKGVVLTLCICRMFPAVPRSPDAAPVRAPMTATEKRLAGLLVATLALWMTDAVHGIAPAWIGLAAACICLLPRVGFLSGEEFASGVSLRTCLYIAGILGLAAFVMHSGLGTVIGGRLVGLLPLDPAARALNFGSLVALTTALNFVVTANGVPALYTPLAASLAASTGFSLAATLMVQVIGYSTPLLPYQASPIVVAMGMAKVRARDGIRLSLAVAGISLIVLVPLQYLWFVWLGWI